MTNTPAVPMRKMTAPDYMEMKNGGLTIEGKFHEVAPGRTPPANHSGAYIYEQQYGQRGVTIRSLEEPESQFDIHL